MFEDPHRFDPGRWGSSRDGEGQRGEASGFRSLAFGFGARQCVGRRIAENEIQLLLMHVSDSRGVGKNQEMSRRMKERNTIQTQSKELERLVLS